MLPLVRCVIFATGPEKTRNIRESDKRGYLQPGATEITVKWDASLVLGQRLMRRSVRIFDEPRQVA